MTQKEKQERIEQLNREIFVLDMKDKWDAADYSLMKSMKDELEELKQND